MVDNNAAVEEILKKVLNKIESNETKENTSGEQTK